jgi:hypothetical protein
MKAEDPSDRDARARLRKRRLAGYALAAGAVVAGEQSARADVIYSGVRDEVLTFAPGSSLNLSLADTASQASRTVDFVFTNFAFSNSRSLGMYGKNNGSPHNGEVADASGNIAGLSAGDHIDPAQKFTTQAATGPNGQTGYFIQHLVSSYNGTAYGNFIGAHGAFLGLRFQIPADNSTHFGWARVSVDDDLTMTLVDWAYESTPGVGILAGAVPEPASLGLLALGAAGVIALRRGRKSD